MFLILFVGLELFSKHDEQSPSVHKAIKSILPHKRTISAKTFHKVQPTLIAACAGRFGRAVLVD